MSENPLSKKPWLVKMLLLVVSTFFCFLATELILRIYTYRFQTTTKLDLRLETVSDESLVPERHDDIYELYPSHSAYLEIVAVGDSYTNGGNVQWDQSYPFQLFTQMQKKVPVINMGICEDTTKGSHLRLTDYFKNKKEQNDNKVSIVVLLVGAADIFFDDGFDFEKVYKKIIDGKEIPTETMSVKLMDEESVADQFKTVKMFKFVFNQVKKIFLPSVKLDYFYGKSEIANCMSRLESGKDLCLKSYFEKLNQIFFSRKNDDPIASEKTTYRRITQFLIQENQKAQSSAENIVSDILQFIRITPRSLISPDVIYNLVTYATMQSHFDIRTDVFENLQKSFLKEKEYIKSHADSPLDNAEKIIQALEKWLPRYEKTNELQNNYYEKIIKLVKLNQSHLILLSYPRPYHKTNAQIKSIAVKNQIPFLDLEKIFSDKMKAGFKENDLIGDWEHCTPFGYSIIASAVYAEIKRLFPNL